MTDSARSPQARAVTRLAEREPPRFAEIFEAEFSYVVHTLRRLGVRERDLDDVTQEVFITVHRSLDRFDSSRPVRPWLFGHALRHASDYRRLARHQRELLDGDAGPAEHADERPIADAELAASERRAMVVRALDALDLDRRAVLVLHDIEGNAMPVAAEVLAIPLNTAYSRLRLAREQFRAEVQRLRRTQGDP